jgi:uncharacterized membrane protein
MRTVRPIHGLILVVLAAAAVVAGDYALEGGFSRSQFERVAPGADGTVRIGLADLAKEQVRFYRFLNPANQEVKFFVGRDAAGAVQVAFDASDVCLKRKRGFRHEGDWMVCNQCDKSFRLESINSDPGGCAPRALAHSLEGDTLVLTEDAVLAGWRFYR